jgi:NADPH:quinone reductase-like Zn-dependent oxidoreductase
VFITAWKAVYDQVQLDQGTTILIHAGADGLAHVAIESGHTVGKIALEI